jgi:hypothetical protein
MAGGVITAGLLGLGGSLLGAVGESQNQKQSFILQNAMANATIEENRRRRYEERAEKRIKL